MLARLFFFFIFHNFSFFPLLFFLLLPLLRWGEGGQAGFSRQSQRRRRKWLYNCNPTLHRQTIFTTWNKLFTAANKLYTHRRGGNLLDASAKPDQPHPRTPVAATPNKRPQNRQHHYQPHPETRPQISHTTTDNLTQDQRLPHLPRDNNPATSPLEHTTNTTTDLSPLTP